MAMPTVLKQFFKLVLKARDAGPQIAVILCGPYFLTACRYSEARVASRLSRKVKFSFSDN